MELISWNVNGIRACINKGMLDWIVKRKPDILCIQETKAQPEQVLMNLPSYNFYWSSAEKKGYSGVLTLSKEKSLSVKKGFGIKKFDEEGRFLQLEYDEFYLINLYFPNAQRELKRLDFKLEFNEELLKYVEILRKKSTNKGIILCGDFNVAHKEIDLKNPKTNMKNAGFSPEERESFTKFLERGYLDTFREFDQSPGKYTWWTYRSNARARNIGWRIDYFVINQNFQKNLKSAFILQDVMGSDHCPVGISI
ncbi:MAG: exodeoxyribonuclease III [Candidatus Hodarchaeales archaeon]